MTSNTPIAATFDERAVRYAPLTVIVKARSIYGETKFYPVNDAAKAFAEIARTKTLTVETLRIIKRMGVTLSIDAGATLDALRI